MNKLEPKKVKKIYTALNKRNGLEPRPTHNIDEKAVMMRRAIEERAAKKTESLYGY